MIREAKRRLVATDNFSVGVEMLPESLVLRAIYHFSVQAQPLLILLRALPLVQCYAIDPSDTMMG